MPENEEQSYAEYSRAFEALLPRLSERSRYLEACQAAVDQDLPELLARVETTPATDLARGEERFRNPLLVTRLIQLSEQEVTLEPEQAQRLAEIAFDLAAELDYARVGEDMCRDLAIRAQAHRANALRAAGQLAEAEAIFRRVAKGLSNAADPLLKAEVLRLVSSLEKDRRQFADAQNKLQRALELYRSVDDSALQGRTLLLQASLAWQQGNAEEAIEILNGSLDLLAEDTHPPTMLYARHNLATYLCTSGRYSEARERLREAAPLYEQFASPWTELRRRWVESKIALGLGETEAGEALLDQVRRGFLDQGNPYDAAMVTLDLVLVYLEQGRHGEIYQQATELIEVFRTLGVEREALASLLVLQEAARREAVSRKLVEQLVARLETSRGGAGERRELAPS